MPREVRPALQTLIDSGHLIHHSCVDITLTSETELHLSTGQLTVDVPEEQVYNSDMKDPSPFSTSLGLEADVVEFKIQNADRAIGELLSSSTRQMDGARAIWGVIFTDRDTLLSYYDAKCQGELAASEVDEAQASFELLADPDSVIISGETIASAFPWRENITTGRTGFGPNRTGGGGYTDPDSPNDTGQRLGGRYGNRVPMDFLGDPVSYVRDGIDHAI
jgi:hypothetical protein